MNEEKQSAVQEAVPVPPADDITEKKPEIDIEHILHEISRVMQELKDTNSSIETSIFRSHQGIRDINDKLQGLLHRTACLEDQGIRDINDKLQGLLHRTACLEDQGIRDIKDELLGLASYIEENSKRTRRLEEGYDFQILKNFAKQIIREITNLKTSIEKTDDPSQKEIMQDTVDGLEELLERNSITAISPEAGSSYAGQEKFAECAPTKIFVDDESLNGRIASVVRDGYQYEFNDGSVRVIVPARVILFSTSKAQCMEESAFTRNLAVTIKEKIKELTRRQQVKDGYDGIFRNRRPLVLVWNKESLITLLAIVMSIISVVLSVAVYKQHRTIVQLMQNRSADTAKPEIVSPGPGPSTNTPPKEPEPRAPAIAEAGAKAAAPAGKPSKGKALETTVRSNHKK